MTHPVPPLRATARPTRAALCALLVIATPLSATGTPHERAVAPTSRPTRTALRPVPARAITLHGTVRDGASGRPLDQVQVTVTPGRGGAPRATTTAADGRWRLALAEVAVGDTVTLVAQRAGYAAVRQLVRVPQASVPLDLVLSASRPMAPAAPVADARGKVAQEAVAGHAPPRVAMATLRMPGASQAGGLVAPSGPRPGRVGDPDWNREQYDRITDNPFVGTAGTPRSTFSIDVDRASYGNVRRFLQRGERPPADAVRIEELVNYFPYDLPAPTGRDPVAITTEVTPAPWQPRHQLVRIALQAPRIPVAQLPPVNLVFLVDVSGSMQSPDKLPLVKASLRLLVETLRPTDHVALVAYAGAAGLVLPPTSGEDKAVILRAIDELEAGGSTAGGAGLELAYRVAREHFARGGVNRVVLASDGDFNVGPSSDAEMERLVERRRAEGTTLTVLGFGTGNYQDAKMQKLAQVGNGNAAYIDDLAEARKVLVEEMGGTLVTVAQDVKLQVEFNPAEVTAYRLIGYENRLLRDEDFRDDAKDAGDLGAGHSVTALYEVVPRGVTGTVTVRTSDPLRYRTPEGGRPAGPAARGELLHVALRYKRPGETASRELTHVVSTRDLVARGSDDQRFAAAVAAFGMVLRESEHRGSATLRDVLAWARAACGRDPGGHRREFVGLVERAWGEPQTGRR